MKQFPNQFTIEIPEVPEGWKPVAFRPHLPGESYIAFDGSQVIENDCSPTNGSPRLIVKKIQPRRIVLEEAGRDYPRQGDFVLDENGAFYRWGTTNQGSYKYQVFKVIEDTGE